MSARLDMPRNLALFDFSVRSERRFGPAHGLRPRTKTAADGVSGDGRHREAGGLLSVPGRPAHRLTLGTYRCAFVQPPVGTGRGCERRVSEFRLPEVEF